MFLMMFVGWRLINTNSKCSNTSEPATSITSIAIPAGLYINRTW